MTRLLPSVGPCKAPFSYHAIAFLLLGALSYFQLSLVDAASSLELSSCESDEYCQQLLKRQETKCLPSGQCSNPFHQGCLYVLGKDEEFKSKRTCNSDDDDTDQENNDCVISALDFPEVRIHHADWEGSILLAWIYQILLSELVGVPATVGLSNEDTKMASFYSIENTMEYSSVGYPYDALEKANQVDECHLTNEPCVDVLPEVWPGQRLDYEVLVGNGTIEPPVSNGAIGEFSFYIPVYTAKEYPSLLSYYGLQGESNREFLSEIFKRPITWLVYCQEVSSTKCQEPDATASRLPDNSDEEELYFMEGLYTGYFQATEKNICDKNTTGSLNCTGHLISPPCTWSVNYAGQLHWNNIVGLEEDGPYTHTHATLQQVWRAANATRSHVMMVWYQPDVFLEEFFGSEGELQPIVFPTASQTCDDNRPTKEVRCSEDVSVRVGDPIGACDYKPEALKKIMASSFGETTMNTPDVEQSPAYELIRSTMISELQMNEIFQDWINKSNTDRSAHYAREAVCEWVVNNLDGLVQNIPPGHPRVAIDSSHNIPFFYGAQGLGAFVGLLALVSLFLCWKFRKSKVIVFAQPLFMTMILIGYLCISIGAVSKALEPSEASCLSVVWLVILGYSIELVSIMVKVSAIIKLIRSSKKMQRVNISRSVLFRKIAVTLSGVIIFLICWTVLDPFIPVILRTISRQNPNVVEQYLSCTSESSAWTFTAIGWEVFLLLIAAVLACQSRNVMKQFNDSRTVGLLVYAHLLFLLFRLILIFLKAGGGNISPLVIDGLLSYAYSLDAFCAMAIYVFPKIFKAWKAPETAFASLARTSKRSTTVLPEDEDLKVLLCTANIGNAEPTRESMEAWIPPGGRRELVTALDGQPMDSGYFGLVVIGMQESTWKAPKKEISEQKKEKLREEDVLNALEEHHTAALRTRIDDILGEEYTQVAEDQRGQMRLYIFALNNIVEDIDGLRITGANTGIGNVMANKGGIVITLKYKKSRISFLSAHLAAHEGASHYKARCENVRSILREGRTFDSSSKLDISLSSHHVFVMGDLNFRTNFGTENSHEENVARAMNFIQEKDFQGLYNFDELHKGVEKGDLLFGFQTLPCLFPPTFKVNREAGFLYKNQRTPSYTDRILFKSAAGLKQQLKPLAYEPCVDFITSDHKPIRGAFSIIPNELENSFSKLGKVCMTFRKMKCFDLPDPDANGKVDPYLMFIWDSVELESEQLSYKDKIRQLVAGKSWPRTSFIPQDVNPKWKGHSISLVTKDPIVSSDAMLFILAMDHGTVGLKDHLLGAVALNVRELLSRNESEPKKEFAFHCPLERDGKHAGRIKFKLDVEMDQMTRPRRSIAAFSAMRMLPSRRVFFSSRDLSVAGDGEDDATLPQATR